MCICRISASSDNQESQETRGFRVSGESFIQRISEQLLCARHCSRGWEPSSEQTKALCHMEPGALISEHDQR